LRNSALVNGKDASGKSIFSGKKATGFSNVEENLAGAVKAVPFLLEDRIKELGGAYESAAEPWNVSVPFSVRFLNPGADCTSVPHRLMFPLMVSCTLDRTLLPLSRWQKLSWEL
jgi:hypothetical protein